MKLLKALSFLCYKKFSEQTKNTQKGDLVCFFYRIFKIKPKYLLRRKSKCPVLQRDYIRV